MTPEISVCVPVYNAEKYLPDCLQSIEAQTYPHFEILCIDDGSTDNSPALLQKAAANDPRIRIVTQKNAGLAAVRNRSIELAHGKYIAFVDADDLIVPTYLEKLHQAAQKGNAQIVAGGVQHIEEAFSLGTERESPTLPSGKARTIEDLTARFWAGYKDNPVWNKLWLRSWLLDKGLRFPSGKVCEDFLFTILAFLEAQRIVYIPETVYLYRQNVPNSITSRLDKMLLDKFSHIFTLRDEIKKRNLWNQKIAALWVNIVIRRIAGLRKLSVQEKPKGEAFLEKALVALREEVPSLGMFYRLKGKIFLLGARYLKGNALYWWSKLFR